jgi:site-specific DNA-methyltransferase (adenine-specific)
VTVPYYQDDQVTLFHGDCREITDWLTADVLVTDPPYGIGWRRGTKPGIHVDHGHSGIANDKDTKARDVALGAWGDRPGLIFGSFYAPQPINFCHVLVYVKAVGSGVVGSTTGWRRDLEPVYLTGRWPQRAAKWSSCLPTLVANAGGPGSPPGRTGHPHAKPLDVMETLISACPPGTVADPFAGSGSTLIAARNLGRRAIGVELEERYCETAARRLSQMALPL